MVYVFLADGFEEIEAIAPIDILRRADIPILTVGVTGKSVTGAHGITLEADILMDSVEPDKLSCIILPGGMPGTTNLEKNEKLSALIDFAAENKLLICAICAAPMILGKKNLLNGRKATCYPGFEEHLHGAKLSNFVCQDENYITAVGAGAALPFGYAILNALGEDAEKMKQAMRYE